ncbi:MAG: hypothetical protein ACTHLP_05420, partial [Rhizobiaceae bacterium]
MALAAESDNIAQGNGFGRFVVRHSVICAWAAMSLFFALCHLAGYSPSGDLDDLLKQVEIRHFLETGS